MTLSPEFHFLEVAYPYVARRLLTDEDPALRERLFQVCRHFLLVSEADPCPSIMAGTVPSGRVPQGLLTHEYPAVRELCQVSRHVNCRALHQFAGKWSPHCTRLSGRMLTSNGAGLNKDLYQVSEPSHNIHKHNGNHCPRDCRGACSRIQSQLPWTCRYADTTFIPRHMSPCPQAFC